MTTFRLNQKLIRSLGYILFIHVPELIELTVKNRATWYKIMQNPLDITIQQLLSISNGLHIPVRKFFSTGRTDIIGKREDYVIEPFLPCRYEANELQRIVNTQPSTTWKKASEATGITRDNLKNSLLGTTRTPINRFLIVCEAFDVDPFTILIDPNPEAKRSRRATSSTPNSSPANDNEVATLRAEIATLHSQMTDLHTDILDLRTKYEALLSDHEQLAKRVGVSIETINNNGYLGIAAEPEAKYGIRENTRKDQ